MCSSSVFWCHPNYDVTFKITNKLIINNNNLKFNNNFKNHITIERTHENTKRALNIFFLKTTHEKST
jgi:hypothetical protein